MNRSIPPSAIGRSGTVLHPSPAPRSLADLRRSALLPMWPHELTDLSVAGRRLRIERLRLALRAERQRGLAGHWSYDLARHCGLLRWYRAEIAELEAVRPHRLPSSPIQRHGSGAHMSKPVDR